MLERKEERENKIRDDDRMYQASKEFASVVGDVLMNAMDTKGVFNAIRDMINNKTGTPDPMAMQKLMFSQMQVTEAQRIVVPFGQVKMDCPPEIVGKATRVNAAIMTLANQTTEPFAKQLAIKVAADELDAFFNTFRDLAGQDRYSKTETQRDVNSFLATLKLQVDAYMEEAKKDMKAAGFKTTPWDNLGKQ